MSELSKTNGTTTSANNRAEVTHISRNGLILWVKDREYYLPYDKFPWFKRAAVDDVFNVQPEDYWASCIFVASDTPFSLNASMVK
jgi:hypothetical protein